MDTRTGSLKQPFNVAKRVLSSHSRIKSSSLNKISSPRLQRSSTSLGGSRTRLKSSDHSDGSSSSAISSLEDLHWIGDPEATKSVRRNRKSSEEQHLEYELKRIASSKRQVTKRIQNNVIWYLVMFYSCIYMYMFYYNNETSSYYRIRSVQSIKILSTRLLSKTMIYSNNELQWIQFINKEYKCLLFKVFRVVKCTIHVFRF